MSEEAIRRNDDELDAIRAIAGGRHDAPVLMLNLNRYTDEARFPDGELYRSYMAVLEQFLPVVGGEILWRFPVYGQPVGAQRIDEVLAAWYPSHQAFVDLASAPGADENYRLRARAVDYAVIHRCPGIDGPFHPGTTIAS